MEATHSYGMLPIQPIVFEIDRWMSRIGSNQIKMADFAMRILWHEKMFEICGFSSYKKNKSFKWDETCSVTVISKNTKRL